MWPATSTRARHWLRSRPPLPPNQVFVGRDAEAAEERGSQHVATLLNNVEYHFKIVADFAARAGSVAKNQGDLPAACAYLERALRIFEQKLGREHPTTRIVRGNLAAVLAALGEGPPEPLNR